MTIQINRNTFWFLMLFLFFLKAEAQSSNCDCNILTVRELYAIGQFTTLKENLKVNFSISYNVFGRRIYNVGIYGLGDVYELPVNSLNLVAGVELEHFKFGFRVNNLLNQDIRFEQETPNEPIIINSARRGVFTSLSVGYKF